MTEYEFEYEFLQDIAYKDMLTEFANTERLDIDQGGFTREFKMDEDEYNYIRELSEQEDAYIDFEIPADAPEGGRLSEKLLGIEREAEYEPVDLSKEFDEG